MRRCIPTGVNVAAFMPTVLCNVRYALSIVARTALLVASACVPFPAQSACLPSADPVVRQYEDLIGTQALDVGGAVSKRLQAGTETDPIRRAALYGVLAEAYSALERYDEVLVAAEKGLALVPDTTSPVYVNLLYWQATNTFHEQKVPAALVATEAARKQQAAGSPGEACLLMALGTLEHFRGRLDQASIYLTRAYRMSHGTDRVPQRILAADTLSIVMRDLKNHSQALALNQEVIDWDLRRGATLSLATSRFMRGAILQDMGDHSAALEELAASRNYGIKMKDAMGVAYADLLMCTSNIHLQALRDARAQCNAAVDAFREAESVDPEKQVLAALAEIDLLEDQPAAALAKLDRVLDADGRDIAQMRVTRLYQMRSQAHEALGQYREALADARIHMQRFKASNDEERSREAAALRTQFETDREIARNAFLQRELELKNERLGAQSERMRWMVQVAVAGICVISLLTYLLLANKRKKLLLARLAQLDDLTDLPNRRRTFELASEAFDAARRQATPLTIGILDLDHFKHINDRYGHPLGDFVLREFSRLGSGAVRASDVLGRWGGEEFLLILPNTTLDVALSIVDRIRAATSRIKGGALADDFKLTLSAGLATNEGGPAHLEEIIACADAALYDAKEGGRDLVCVAPESYSLASTGVRRVLKGSGVELTTGSFGPRNSGTNKARSDR
jgi:diguanylate cyclase (GGDEF)-like protein